MPRWRQNRAGRENESCWPATTTRRSFASPGIGHNQGETAVRVFHRQMPQAGHSGLAGDAPAVLLQMQRKVAQRVVLAAPP